MSRSRSERSSPNDFNRSLSIWLCALVLRPSTFTLAISFCKFCVSSSFACTSSCNFAMRFWLFAATRSQVIFSLDSSSILPNKPEISRDTLWMFRSCTSIWWVWSAICAFSFVVSSTCESMVFFTRLNWSISFSLSCLMAVICVLRNCISLSFRSRKELSCSWRSCSDRIEFCNPRISFSIASSPSSCSFKAFCTFCRASSLRCMPTRDDRHCCMSCFFSNSIASISLAASRNVAMAASVSCFWATTWASVNAFCSVMRFRSSFIVSMRRSCLCFCFSICLM
mmetsp:Transcript_110781/g.309598  ORF Transcript_110781/g.309598 Transcript_110781/m.309598 type:complete len:282 (+) Transcript_110781:714-1559(+)